MKVIYTQDIRGKAKKGQMAEVSDGYARNYLFPRNLAVAATADSINAMKITDEAQKRRKELEKQEALNLKKTIEEKTVKMFAKAGTGGRLFGSVTSKEIAEALKEQFGIEVSKNKIVMDEAIKNFGTFNVKVKLYPEISASLKVMVTESK